MKINQKVSASLLIELIVIVACLFGAMQVAIPTPPPDPTATPTLAPNVILTATPENWDTSKLSGQLILALKQRGVFKLDLASLAITPIYETPASILLTAAAVSPDSKQIAMTYGGQADRASLYIVPIESSSKQQPFFFQAQSHEIYSDPTWSPDGKYVYYTHDETIERLSIEDGTVETIIEKADRPRLTPDGTKLAYLLEGISLYIADADGKEPMLLENFLHPYRELCDFLFIDDGQTIILSVVNYHGFTAMCSTWEYLSVENGLAENFSPTPVLFSIYGSLSPDGKYVAYVKDGTLLYVMTVDDKEGVWVASSAETVSTLDWIP